MPCPLRGSPGLAAALQAAGSPWRRAWRVPLTASCSTRHAWLLMARGFDRTRISCCWRKRVACAADSVPRGKLIVVHEHPTGPVCCGAWASATGCFERDSSKVLMNGKPRSERASDLATCLSISSHLFKHRAPASAPLPCGCSASPLPPPSHPAPTRPTALALSTHGR